MIEKFSFNGFAIAVGVPLSPIIRLFNHLPKSGKTNVQVTAKWVRIPGGLTRISKGKAGVWGVNKNQDIFRLNANGEYFLLELLLFVESSS